METRSIFREADANGKYLNRSSSKVGGSAPSKNGEKSFAKHRFPVDPRGSAGQLAGRSRGVIR